MLTVPPEAAAPMNAVIEPRGEIVLPAPPLRGEVERGEVDRGETDAETEYE